MFSKTGVAMSGIGKYEIVDGDESEYLAVREVGPYTLRVSGCVRENALRADVRVMGREVAASGGFRTVGDAAIGADRLFIEAIGSLMLEHAS